MSIYENDNIIEENELLIKKELKSEEESSKNYDNIHFQIEPGELLIVVGEVGSGKSRLLLKLLGEIDNNDSIITISKKIAYYSEDT